MDKEKIVIEITKKDKVYLSVIGVLIAAIICLAICLPRQYKFVDKEVVVYQDKQVKVYETEKLYLISPLNSLYNASLGYYEDFDGNKYVSGYNQTYVGTGKLEKVIASVIVDEAGIDVKKPMEIIEALVEAFVEDKSQNGFGVEVNLDYYIMKNIRERFIGLLGEGKVGELDNYLIELKFETAEINLLVSFLDE